MEIEGLTKELIFTEERGVGTLTLNRPERLNALTVTMLDGMRRVIEWVHNKDSIKVLIITGSGKGFCSGADVAPARFEEILGQVSKTRREMIEPIGYIVSIIRRLSKPVIGAINGVAAGSGFSLALLCDIRIASDEAKFVAVWVRRGLIPDAGATYLLPRTIGIDKAMELSFTGEPVDAEEAKRIGLVTRVVPHDDLMKAAGELALKIAKGPSVAIELMKRGIYRGLDNDLDTQLDFETFAQNLCSKTEDFKEGTDAFREKREPRFEGK